MRLVFYLSPSGSPILGYGTLFSTRSTGTGAMIEHDNLPTSFNAGSRQEVFDARGREFVWSPG